MPFSSLIYKTGNHANNGRGGPKNSRKSSIRKSARRK